MRHKKILLLIICSLSLLSYHIYIWRRQCDFAMLLDRELEDFKSQQLVMLQSLSQQLLPAIKRNDLVKISTSLSNYEDLAFIFAKSYATVPINIYFVSLTAPGILVGSIGKLDLQMLAADEEYYMRTINNPTQINFAKTYINATMPEYVMVHWGLGILDGEVYCGQLDVKASLNALNIYLQHKIVDNFLFTYKIAIQEQLRAEISLNWPAYCGLLLLWMLFSIAATGGTILIVEQLRKLYANNLQFKRDIDILHAQHFDLTQRIENYRLATTTQHAYALLLDSKTHTSEQKIKLQQLLQDALVVNYDLAVIRNVQLKLLDDYHNFSFYGNQIHLMQILSGIVYELINELSMGAILQMQYVLSSVAPGIQKIVFKFIDNGFYTQLLDRDELNTRADIRLKGWQNIRDLIELEQGGLEHEHVVYTGNTLSFSIVRKVANNVVILEQLAR